MPRQKEDVAGIAQQPSDVSAILSARIDPVLDPQVGPDPQAGLAQQMRAVPGLPSETDIRMAQDLMFFAYRDFTNAADAVLEDLGLGRAHHRALHFIGRNPAITVSDLLSILRITKQSLARVLGALVARGYVAQAPGPVDRRQRLLTLTPKGQALERKLFDRQYVRLAAGFRQAGDAAIDGFRRVMRAIVTDTARAYLDYADARASEGRASDAGGLDASWARLA